ncbi:hypothetical protein GCM10009413_07840 [Tatumella punctata]
MIGGNPALLYPVIFLVVKHVVKYQELAPYGIRHFPFNKAVWIAAGNIPYDFPADRMW